MKNWRGGVIRTFEPALFIDFILLFFVDFFIFHFSYCFPFFRFSCFSHLFSSDFRHFPLFSFIFQLFSMFHYKKKYFPIHFHFLLNLSLLLTSFHSNPIESTSDVHHNYKQSLIIRMQHIGIVKMVINWMSMRVSYIRIACFVPAYVTQCKQRSMFSFWMILIRFVEGKNSNFNLPFSIPFDGRIFQWKFRHFSVIWRMDFYFHSIRPMNYHNFPMISFTFRSGKMCSFRSSQKWWRPRMACAVTHHMNEAATFNRNVNYAFFARTANQNVNWNAWPISQRASVVAFDFSCQVNESPGKKKQFNFRF